MQGAAYATMFTEMSSIPVDRVVILIGVDTANFCQTLVVEGDELFNWKQELNKYILAYRKKVDITT
jgi:DNA-binding ferritin-like protein (Dps family)